MNDLRLKAAELEKENNLPPSNPEFEKALTSEAQDRVALNDFIDKLIAPYGKYKGVICFLPKYYRG